MPAPYRLLIVEDHPIMRSGYEQFFGMQDDLEVAGATETAEDALAFLDAATADLALVDVSLPGMDGYALVQQLRETHPDLLTLVVTGHHEHRYEAEAERAGAHGFVRKGDPARLLEAVRALLTA